MKYPEFLKHKYPSAESVERVWKGSIDMHVHFAPDPGAVRRFDGLETVLAARDAGMKALVLKSDHCPTTQTAFAAQRAAPEVKVFSSLNIEYATTGGLGDHTVDAILNHAKMGAKVLWFPTFSAAYTRKFIPGLEGTGITILDENGQLKAVAPKILEVVKEYNMVLCSGHLSFDECDALFGEARRQGITKMVLTHPMADLIWDAMTIDQMRHFADLGVFIEQVYAICMPLLGGERPEIIMEAIKAIGAKRTIMCTDFAEIADSSPAEGLRQFIATMLQLGIPEEDVELMVKTNPSKLLDI